MPAKDIYHDTVKTALEKDGWTITHDPYYLTDKPNKINYEIDLLELVKQFNIHLIIFHENKAEQLQWQIIE